VSRVEFFNGANKLGEDTSSPYSYDWSSVPAGSYTLTAVGTDNTGATATSPAVAISVGVPLPTVSLTSPASGASSAAPATISLTATASAGSGATIARVEFFNGPTKLGEDTSSPYAWSWTGVSGGTYTLTATATDSLGQVQTSAPVIVTVTGASNTVLVGVNTIQSTSDWESAGTASAYPYTAGASGTASTLFIYTDGSNAATTLRLGLYADSGSNRPGTLLANGSCSVAGIPAATAGWYSCNLTNGPMLNANTRYWIAALSPSGGGAFRWRHSSGGASSYSVQGSALSTLPATWSQSASYTGEMRSAYVTASLGGSPPSVSLTPLPTARIMPRPAP